MPVAQRNLWDGDRAGKRHDDLRGQRNTCRLNPHQKKYAEIAGLRDYGDGESGQRRNDFLDHPEGLEILRSLGKSIAGQSHAGFCLGNFHPDRFRVRSANSGRTEHSVLCEQFSVNFGDQEVIATCVAAPNLAGLYYFDHLRRLLTVTAKRPSGVAALRWAGCTSSCLRHDGGPLDRSRRTARAESAERAVRAWPRSGVSRCPRPRRSIPKNGAQFPSPATCDTA